MKYLLIVMLIVISNLSAFAQIDTSVWKRKTVLVVMESISTSNRAFYDNLEKEFSKNWYLTDTFHFVIDTLINENINHYGQDTVVIIWKTDWQKIYIDRNCMPSENPEDCMIWSLSESFQIKNFQTKEWETYIYPFYEKEGKSVLKFQNSITNSPYKPNYKGKKVIIKNQTWSVELENLLKAKFENTDLKIVLDTRNRLVKSNRNDGIYIYWQHFPLSKYIEIVDLQTNQVIETLRLEK